MSKEMGTTVILLTDDDARLAIAERGALPGPWKFLPDKFNRLGSEGCVGSVVTDESDPWYIATIETAPHAQASALLIAAAPDMLVALKAAQEALFWYKAENFEFGNDGATVGNQVASAIAKAEGRAP